MKNWNENLCMFEDSCRSLKIIDLLAEIFLYDLFNAYIIMIDLIVGYIF